MDASRNKINIVALAAISCAISVIAPTPSVVRLAAGLPLMFYLPGFAILQAASGPKIPGRGGMTFAVGLSIVVTVFCGFALHVLGAMTREGWAIALCLPTLAGCVVGRVWAPSPAVVDALPDHPRLLQGQAIILISAIGIAAGAVALARQEALARREFNYTEFWMVPDGDSLFAVGIRNAEAGPSRYDVEVSVNGSLVRIWRGIPLAAGESWTADLAVPIEPAGGKRAEAWLFKDGDHRRVYRRVWLTDPMEG